jgi:hypothetical protein
MEITLNIPKNTYEVPTEVRPEVVQAICEAFLCGNCNATYYPFSSSVYRKATHHVELRNGKGVGFINPSDYQSARDTIRFHGCEMSAAVSALRQAGYHIFRIYYCGTWMGYRLSAKPFYMDGTEVREINDFID